MSDDINLDLGEIFFWYYEEYIKPLKQDIMKLQQEIDYIKEKFEENNKENK